MILLALGSNLGDREANLAAARASLIAFDIAVVRVSGIYETPALVPDGAPTSWNIPYLNQVIAVETHLSPAELLICLKHIESELGRKPAERWAPREIDIDILAYGEQLVLTEALTIPHPHLDARDFVLRPLAEIAPDWQHPVLGKSALEMLAELGA